MADFFEIAWHGSPVSRDDASAYASWAYLYNSQDATINIMPTYAFKLPISKDAVPDSASDVSTISVLSFDRREYLVKREVFWIE